MEKVESISVVVPCYNSQKSLDELVERLAAALPALCHSFEVILVNDYSRDGTWGKIRELAVKNPFVKGVDMMKNFGQHSAILCGFNYSTGDYVVTMDDDLQNPPEEIARLLAPMADPAIDAVIGAPADPKKSLVRKWGSDMLNVCTSRILGKPLSLKMAAFRVLRRRLVDQVKSNRTVNPALGSLLLSYTRNMVNVTVENRARKYGRSGYTMRKSAALFFNNVLNYSMIPLKVMGWLGSLVSLFSFGLAVYYLIEYFTGHTGVPGWTTLAVLVSFFSGLILISLSILGTYLMRVTREVNHTPQYAVRETLNL